MVFGYVFKKHLIYKINVEFYTKEMIWPLGFAFEYFKIDRELGGSIEKIRLTMSSYFV